MADRSTKHFDGYADTECKDCLELIDERDYAQEWADTLADGIARYFNVNIGEHSNLNKP